MTSTIGVFYDLPPHVSAYVTVRGDYQRIVLRYHLPRTADARRVRFLVHADVDTILDTDIVYDRDTSGCHADIEVFSIESGVAVAVDTPAGSYTIDCNIKERISVLPV